jgi:glycosyltransferase involved in cell wall biosynthesis
MNILLLNHYAGSPQHGMEYRPFYLAREWVRLGHVASIVGASFSHARTHQPSVAQERHEGVGYRWLETPAYRGNGSGRAMNMASFCAQLVWRARALVRQFKPHVVIASSTYPMDIWPAARIAHLAGARLIHEVHDLWPRSPIELGGMSARHPFIRVCQAAEDYACRHADAVVSMLPHVHAYLASRGLDLTRLHIVPNGVSPTEWAQSVDGAVLPHDLLEHLAQTKARKYSIITYAGAHGLANSLDTLLCAAEQLKDQPLSFVLVGQGPEREHLQQTVQRRHLQNVRLFDPIEKNQMPLLLAQTDVAYIGLQRAPIFRFGIAPNKLMDYMMASCVVLSAIEAGNDPVTESGCGLNVAAQCPTAVAQGLLALLSLPTKTRAKMGEQGRQFILENHTWPVLAAQFLRVMQDLVA